MSAGKALAGKVLWRGVILVSLALVMAVGTMFNYANAHDGQLHATSVAEGGSTLVPYDQPGPDPLMDFWHECSVAIKHTVSTTTGLNWYRPVFKCNSWKGIFAEDETVLANADPAAANYTIRLALFLRDTETGILTPLQSQYDGWGTRGGFAYGCQGEGRLSQVNPQPTKELVADLRVFGEQKYWHYIDHTWRTVPNTFKTHQTRSYRLGTVWVTAEPSSLGHGYATDPLTGYFVNQVGGSPNAYVTGDCELWRTQQP